MHLVATTASRGQIKVWTFGNLLNLSELGNKFVTAAVTWGYNLWAARPISRHSGCTCLIHGNSGW